MNNEIAAIFLDISAHKMDAMYVRVEKSLARLTEEQVWERHADHENTIANLMLHLCGNIRQWIMHGVGNQPDVRERDKEFSAAKGMSKAELLTRFRTTLEEAKTVIRGVPAERLLEKTDPQLRGEVYVFDAIFEVVGHIQEHVGQIVLLTKQMYGHDLDLTIPRPR